ncbi:hypothetical protein [Streptomyces sp. NPDC046942]|uniref:hypothetical protein n=1 Tax=Streptomyces sp. NPDC046942 TaxID=3155137 RepID=UPI0033C628F8
MAIPVHALVHRPLTVQAVAELVALPTAPQVPDDSDAMTEEMRRRGWEWEHQLVCDSFRTAHQHVVCDEYGNPFGNAGSRTFLVFGEVYPVDPSDEDMRNGPWLYGYIEGWEQVPGWVSRRPSTDEDCEAVLAQAAQAVTEHLGEAPERTTASSYTAGIGPELTHRIWRTPTHALILGPTADNGPYGYLTHLQLSSTPLTCAPDLPPAGDKDGLDRWIAAHIDW